MFEFYLCPYWSERRSPLSYPLSYPLSCLLTRSAALFAHVCISSRSALRSQSLKGVGGNIVVLEEAAVMPPPLYYNASREYLRPDTLSQYCDLQVVNEVVLPLLSMQDSCLLCISTLLPSSNHYSRMFEVTDRDGNRIFESIQISLVCGTQDGHTAQHTLCQLPCT